LGGRPDKRLAKRGGEKKTVKMDAIEITRKTTEYLWFERHLPKSKKKKVNRWTKVGISGQKGERGNGTKKKNNKGG